MKRARNDLLESLTLIFGADSTDFLADLDKALADLKEGGRPVSVSPHQHRKELY